MFFWYERSFPLFLKQSFDFLGFPFMTFRRKGGKETAVEYEMPGISVLLYFLNI